MRTKTGLARRRQIAEEYLHKGLLHGIEYLDLTSEHRFRLEGVEEPVLYYESLRVYRESAAKREAFGKYLDEIASTIEVLKPRLLNPFLLSFLLRYERAKTDEDLTGYIDFLLTQASALKISSGAYPHLMKLSELKKMEMRIDFKTANEEQVKAVRTLSDDDRRELEDLSEASKLSLKESQAGYFLRLTDKLKNPEAFPELEKYLQYLRRSRGIDAREILAEKEKLEESVFAGLKVSEDEAKLLDAVRTLGYYRKLFHLSLTPEEFDRFKKTKSAGLKSLSGFLNEKLLRLDDRHDKAVFLKEDFDGMAALCERFYELTLLRDEKFLENAAALAGVSDKPAVLITGGFHAPNLKSLMRRKNISYVSVVPRVLQETNIRRYEEILLSQPASSAAVKPAAAMTMNAYLAPNEIGSPALTAEFIARFESAPAMTRGARLAEELSPEDQPPPKPLWQRSQLVVRFVRFAADALWRLRGGQAGELKREMSAARRALERILENFEEMKFFDRSDAVAQVQDLAYELGRLKKFAGQRSGEEALRAWDVFVAKTDALTESLGIYFNGLSDAEEKKGSEEISIARETSEALPLLKNITVRQLAMMEARAGYQILVNSVLRRIGEIQTPHGLMLYLQRAGNEGASDIERGNIDRWISDLRGVSSMLRGSLSGGPLTPEYTGHYVKFFSERSAEFHKRLSVMKLPHAQDARIRRYMLRESGPWYWTIESLENLAEFVEARPDLADADAGARLAVRTAPDFSLLAVDVNPGDDGHHLKKLVLSAAGTELVPYGQLSVAPIEGTANMIFRYVLPNKTEYVFQAPKNGADMSVLDYYSEPRDWRAQLKRREDLRIFLVGIVRFLASLEVYEELQAMGPRADLAETVYVPTREERERFFDICEQLRLALRSGRLDGIAPAAAALKAEILKGKLFFVQKVFADDTEDINDLLLDFNMRFDGPAVRKMALYTARALKLVHERGIIHADIKVGNMRIRLKPHVIPGMNRTITADDITGCYIYDFGYSFIERGKADPRSFSRMVITIQEETNKYAGTLEYLPAGIDSLRSVMNDPRRDVAAYWHTVARLAGYRPKVADAAPSALAAEDEMDALAPILVPTLHPYVDFDTRKMQPAGLGDYWDRVISRFESEGKEPGPEKTIPLTARLILAGSWRNVEKLLSGHPYRESILKRIAEALAGYLELSGGRGFLRGIAAAYGLRGVLANLANEKFEQILFEQLLPETPRTGGGHLLEGAAARAGRAKNVLAGAESSLDVLLRNTDTIEVMNGLYETGGARLASDRSDDVAEKVLKASRRMIRSASVDVTGASNSLAAAARFLNETELRLLIDSRIVITNTGSRDTAAKLSAVPIVEHYLRSRDKILSDLRGLAKKLDDERDALQNVSHFKESAAALTQATQSLYAIRLEMISMPTLIGMLQKDFNDIEDFDAAPFIQLKAREAEASLDSAVNRLFRLQLGMSAWNMGLPIDFSEFAGSRMAAAVTRPAGSGARLAGPNELAYLDPDKTAARRVATVGIPLEEGAGRSHRQYPTMQDFVDQYDSIPSSDKPDIVILNQNELFAPKKLSADDGPGPLYFYWVTKLREKGYRGPILVWLAIYRHHTDDTQLADGVDAKLRPYSVDLISDRDIYKDNLLILRSFIFGRAVSRSRDPRQTISRYILDELGQGRAVTLDKVISEINRTGLKPKLDHLDAPGKLIVDKGWLAEAAASGKVRTSEMFYRAFQKRDGSAISILDFGSQVPDFVLNLCRVLAAGPVGRSYALDVSEMQTVDRVYQFPYFQIAENKRVDDLNTAVKELSEKGVDVVTLNAPPDALVTISLMMHHVAQMRAGAVLLRLNHKDWGKTEVYVEHIEAYGYKLAAVFDDPPADYPSTTFSKDSRLFVFALDSPGARLAETSGSRLASMRFLTKEAKILAFGSSSTEGVVDPRMSYPAILERTIGRRVINEGIGGERTLDLHGGPSGKTRLPGILERHKPDLLILWHGRNDLLFDAGKTEADVESALLEMIGEAKRRGVQVLLLGSPKTGFKDDPLYERVAAAAGVPYLPDVYDEILSRPDHMVDAIHANAEGNRIIARKIKAFLALQGAIEPSSPPEFQLSKFYPSVSVYTQDLAPDRAVYFTAGVWAENPSVRLVYKDPSDPEGRWKDAESDAAVTNDYGFGYYRFKAVLPEGVEEYSFKVSADGKPSDDAGKKWTLWPESIRIRIPADKKVLIIPTGLTIGPETPFDVTSIHENFRDIVEPVYQEAVAAFDGGATMEELRLLVPGKKSRTPEEQYRHVIIRMAAHFLFVTSQYRVLSLRAPYWVRPDFMTGESLGLEIAMHLAGGFNITDFIRFLKARLDLTDLIAPITYGRIVIAGQTPEQIRTILKAGEVEAVSYASDGRAYLVIKGNSQIEIEAAVARIALKLDVPVDSIEAKYPVSSMIHHTFHGEWFDRRMAEVIGSMTFRDPDTPIIDTSDPKSGILKTADQLKAAFFQAIFEPVFWIQADALVNGADRIWLSSHGGSWPDRVRQYFGARLAVSDDIRFAIESFKEAQRLLGPYYEINRFSKNAYDDLSERIAAAERVLAAWERPSDQDLRDDLQRMEGSLGLSPESLLDEGDARLLAEASDVDEFRRRLKEGEDAAYRVLEFILSTDDGESSAARLASSADEAFERLLFGNGLISRELSSAAVETADGKKTLRIRAAGDEKKIRLRQVGDVLYYDRSILNPIDLPNESFLSIPVNDVLLVGTNDDAKELGALSLAADMDIHPDHTPMHSTHAAIAGLSLIREMLRGRTFIDFGSHTGILAAFAKERASGLILVETNGRLMKDLIDGNLGTSQYQLHADFSGINPDAVQDSVIAANLTYGFGLDAIREQILDKGYQPAAMVLAGGRVSELDALKRAFAEREVYADWRFQTVTVGGFAALVAVNPGKRLAAGARLAEEPPKLPSAEELREWYKQFNAQGAIRKGGEDQVLLSAVSHDPSVRARVVRAISALGPSLSILSVGAGRGHLEKDLIAAGHRVRAIDLSPENARHAKKKHGIDVEIVDAHDLSPLGDEKYDVVVYSESIGHLDLSRAFPAAAARLRDGGHVVITNYLPRPWGREAAFQVSRYFRYLYTEVRDALGGAGLEILSQEEIRSTRAGLEKLQLYVAGRSVPASPPAKTDEGGAGLVKNASRLAQTGGADLILSAMGLAAQELPPIRSQRNIGNLTVKTIELTGRKDPLAIPRGIEILDNELAPVRSFDLVYRGDRLIAVFPVFNLGEIADALKGTAEAVRLTEAYALAEMRYFDLSYYYFKVPGFSAALSSDQITEEWRRFAEQWRADQEAIRSYREQPEVDRPFKARILKHSYSSASGYSVPAKSYVYIELELSGKLNKIASFNPDEYDPALYAPRPGVHQLIIRVFPGVYNPATLSSAQTKAEFFPLIFGPEFDVRPGDLTLDVGSGNASIAWVMWLRSQRRGYAIGLSDIETANIFDTADIGGFPINAVTHDNIGDDGQALLEPVDRLAWDMPYISHRVIVPQLGRIRLHQHWDGGQFGREALKKFGAHLRPALKKDGKFLIWQEPFYEPAPSTGAYRLSDLIGDTLSGAGASIDGITPVILRQDLIESVLKISGASIEGVHPVDPFMIGGRLYYGRINPSRLASEAPKASAAEETVAFLVKVHKATGKTGEIAIGDDIFALKAEDGRLDVYVSGRRLISLDPGQYKEIAGLSGALSAEISMSMADFKLVLEESHRKAAAIPAGEALYGREAVVEINLDHFDPGQGFEEAVLPVLIEELKHAHRQAYGKKAVFLIKSADAGRAERVAAAMNERSVTAFTSDTELPAGYQRKEQRVALATPGAEGLAPGVKRFFLKNVERGDIPNFRAALKLALAIARLEKVDAAGLQSGRIAELLGLFVKDLNIGLLADVVNGLNQDPGAIDAIALPSIVRLPIDSWIRGARMASKLILQSA